MVVVVVCVPCCQSWRSACSLSLVQYELRAADDTTILDASRKLTFVVGEDAVHEALETIVRTMHPKEVARVDVSRRHASALVPCAPNVNKLLATPPLAAVRSDPTANDDAALDAPLACVHVTLLSVDAAPSGWDLPSAEKLRNAARFKDRGNELFAEQRYRPAERKYKHAMTYIEWCNDW